MKLYVYYGGIPIRLLSCYCSLRLRCCSDCFVCRFLLLLFHQVNYIYLFEFIMFLLYWYDDWVLLGILFCSWKNNSKLKLPAWIISRLFWNLTVLRWVTTGFCRAGFGKVSLGKDLLRPTPSLLMSGVDVFFCTRLNGFLLLMNTTIS